MKQYRNVFAELGIPQQEIDARLREITEEFFFGEDKVYTDVGENMGYIEDTGNHDARTEGMSYGMMICVQLDMKEQFDRLWKWAKTYMFMTEGWNEGYFAWSCRTDGTRNSDGPAPDGEEFFAMALFFASKRWGDGKGIFEYSREARELLRACITKGRGGREGRPLWNNENKQILFGPGSDFTDPSYHLPHFYELFARYAFEEDREFFAEAAKASRKFLSAACHPVTGMNPEYAEFDGSPMTRPMSWTKDRHDLFYSDAYRTAANIGLDWEWFGRDEGQRGAAGRLMYTLGVVNADDPFATYTVSGERTGQPALHPVGMLAATAQGALTVAAPLSPGSPDPANALAAEWVLRFWREPMRKGGRRYYDNCLYFFAFLALSGNYRMY